MMRRVKPAGAVSSGSDPGRSPNGGSTMQSRAKSDWSPTVANLLVILVVEIVAFGVIRYVFSRVA